ncbi:hypothetical protein [Vibrio sp. R78045]|uniref:hypothetical protein n=1 Tax=Vibrio sp. R78045 TaxID=3093868 RepID=UPI0036F2F024
MLPNTITFITDTPSLNAKQLLSEQKNETLLFKTLQDQQLARFIAPKQGWTTWDLWQVRQQLPPHWFNQGANAYLGDVLIGSTNTED